jgi:hypothetical protein
MNMAEYQDWIPAAENIYDVQEMHCGSNRAVSGIL